MKKLQVPIIGQRDSRWADILLGNNTQLPYTIGQFGCLITSFCMYLNATGKSETPETINTLLTDNYGFTTGSGNLIWSAVSRLLNLTQVYASPMYIGPVTDQGITKIKELLDKGHPLITHVDFDPRDKDDDQHWLIITGYDGDTIYANDPWSATEISLDVYGGPKRAIIQFKAYDKTLSETSSDTSNTYEKAYEDYVAVSGEIGEGMNKDLQIAQIQKWKSMGEALRNKGKEIEQKDKQIEEVVKQAATLSEEVERLQRENDDNRKKHEEYKKETDKKLEDQTTNIKRLSDRIKELEEVTPTTEQSTTYYFKRFIESLFGW